MQQAEPPMKTLGPRWTLVLPLLVFAAMFLSPQERWLYSSLVSTGVWMAMQWLLPKSRFRVDQYLCPVNIGLFLMLLRLVVVPVLIMTTGAESRVLHQLPPWQSIESALLIDTVSAAALAVGLTLVPNRQLQEPGGAWRTILTKTPGPGFALLFGGLGLIGFMATFRSPAALLAFFTEPLAGETNQQELDGTLLGLLSTLLRPFLAFALVAWWARSVDGSQSGKRAWRPLLIGLGAGLGITLANMTFSFNRAAFVFPLVSMAAVYSARVRRIPVWTMVTALAIAMPLLMAIGSYRSSLMLGGSDAEIKMSSMLRETSETVQAYVVGPQYTGTFYDVVGWGRELLFGKSLIASALSPVPILGKGFRDSSGPLLFNRAIYGVDDIQDQILPFDAELFANFHGLGVVAGFVALGALLRLGERWSDSARSTFAAFCLQYVFLWVAMLSCWSLSVVSQILIYFFCPIYVFVAAIQIRRWLRNSAALQQDRVLADAPLTEAGSR